MVNFLFKKSYQLKTFKPIVYDDLWGKKGIFTTIRVVGEKPNYILLSIHIKNMNSSLKKMNINFSLSQKKICILIESLLNLNTPHDHLLRIAVNSKIISLSMRSRIQPNKYFSAVIASYQRTNPFLKNLYYNKIIKLLNSINIEQQEIILSNRGLLLEGCTTNVLCVRDKTICIPIKNYYRGVTMNYILRKTKRMIKKTYISIKSLHEYEEILLVGSGKGVVSLSSIPQINWKSRSDLIYKELLTSYTKLL